MSDNPYTLRADLLKQAEGILTQRYSQSYERIRYLCDRDMVNPKTVRGQSLLKQKILFLRLRNFISLCKQSNLTVTL